MKSLWREIEKKHTKKNRYYHNLSHLEHLYTQLTKVKDEIQDWEMILFALFYHDYVYNILKQDNEEKSARKAVAVLKQLKVEENRIALCKKIIVATKGHNTSKNNDVNYFTDADLSILGMEWEDYNIYFKQVRKEYKYYPDFVYNKGRIKVLQHFIAMPRIYKTDYFYATYELKAKENLQQEVDLLSK
ncbi:HD domain-containing protein [Aquimarina mytili]|uniref:HD domain-containing protein n=1 Tax=Aquimarina mytili TaxID=874423 RepID=UPI00191D6D33|nr:hypothetical protein [Aquimarina mytili]